MVTHTKICGIKSPETLDVAVDFGARFIGFVFYPPSPRHVQIDIAKELSLMLPTGVRGVGLFVDPTDEQLEKVLGKVQLDMIQLHGHETPERVQEIKDRYMMPIIKAFPVRDAKDILHVEKYGSVADWYLFDAKSSDPDMPGGTGHSFDWSLLRDHSFDKPWMLSGGLTADNVEQALNVLSPSAIDISSGVESVRGVKDNAKIEGFLTIMKDA